MKLNYYPETDSLYITLSEQPSVENLEISDGVNTIPIITKDAHIKSRNWHKFFSFDTETLQEYRKFQRERNRQLK